MQTALLPPTDAVATPASLGSPPSAELIDDRDSISPTDRVVLIVEDDPTFGGLLLGLARSAGLKGVLSNAGSGTLALARKLVPDAITLDLGLSDIDGWVLFDLLRHDQKTKGIPVHVISGAEDIESLARKGASSISTKPVSSDELLKVFQDIHSKKLRIQRRVLVADPDPERRLSLVEAIRDGVTSVTAVGRFAANADDISVAAYDAVVLGFGRSTKDNAQALDEVTG
ncbi:response regulator, partial [Mesorhizobium sp. P5_C1]